MSTSSNKEKGFSNKEKGFSNKEKGFSNKEKGFSNKEKGFSNKEKGFSNKEKGFSLIELLVVVAIIGVLAAVGVVGYQGYIDSTKKSITESNAKAVQQWVVNTKAVRAANIEVQPSNCNDVSWDDDADVQACSDDLGNMSVNGPFESFKNPYDTSRTGNHAVYGHSATVIDTDGTTDCSSVTGVQLGDVVLYSTRTATEDAQFVIFYCVPDATGDDKLVTQSGWTIIWN